MLLNALHSSYRACQALKRFIILDIGCVQSIVLQMLPQTWQGSLVMQTQCALQCNDGELPSKYLTRSIEQIHKPPYTSGGEVW